MNIPVDKIEWKTVNYLRKGETREYEYTFWMNEPLASWDVFDYWERARIHSMQKHLKQGDVFYDIGTEQGWCNLAYAKIVGPTNMVLVEPTVEFWPNIHALWYENFQQNPLATVNALLGEQTKERQRIALGEFIKQSEGDLIDRNSYTYLNNNPNKVPQITLDALVERVKAVPRALNIDVEGAEMAVLKGAKETLKKHDVKVWVSIHDDLAERDYNVKPGQVISYMERLGYVPEFLAEDHETHLLFTKT